MTVYRAKEMVDNEDENTYLTLSSVQNMNQFHEVFHHFVVIASPPSFVEQIYQTKGASAGARQEQ